MKLIKDFSYLLVTLALFFLLKYHNFYGLIFFLTGIFLLFKDNDFDLLNCLKVIVRSLGEYKLLSLICIFLSIFYFIKIFDPAGDLNFQKIFLRNNFSIDFLLDFINISIFFLMVIFWILILSKNISLLISKGFLIFLIINCFDIILDYFTGYSFLRGYLLFSDRPYGLIKSSSQIGAYTWLIFTYCLISYFKFKQTYNILNLWLVSFVIILLSLNRIPLIFHTINLVIVLLGIYKKHLDVKSFFKETYKQLFCIFLIILLFQNIDHRITKKYFQDSYIKISNKIIKIKLYDQKKEEFQKLISKIKNTKDFNDSTLSAADMIFIKENHNELITFLKNSQEMSLVLERFASIQVSNIDRKELLQLSNAKNQICRRVELLLLNVKLIFYETNFFGIRHDKVTNRWEKYKNEECKNEKLKHPHSISFELIHYFGIVIFLTLLFPYFSYLIYSQPIYVKIILCLLLSPSGIGSLTSASFTVLLSLILGLCLKKNEYK